MISRLRQIVIFIDQADIEPFRTGSAVITVDASSGGVLRREAADDRVVFFFRRQFEKAQQASEIRRIPDTRQDGQHSRLIQGILNALILRFPEVKDMDTG